MSSVCLSVLAGVTNLRLAPPRQVLANAAGLNCQIQRQDHWRLTVHTHCLIFGFILDGYNYVILE